MVSGIEVYPVKSLLDVIHFVNTGNGIAPVKVDGDTLLATPSTTRLTSETSGVSKRPSVLSKLLALAATTS
jgi:hypothetical protein